MKFQRTFISRAALGLLLALCLCACSEKDLNNTIRSNKLNIADELLHIEQKINTQYIYYQQFANKVKVQNKWALGRNRFQLEETYNDIYTSLFEIDQDLPSYRPFLYDINITDSNSDSVWFTSSLYLGNVQASLPNTALDPC